MIREANRSTRSSRLPIPRGGARISREAIQEKAGRKLSDESSRPVDEVSDEEQAKPIRLVNPRTGSGGDE